MKRLNFLPVSALAIVATLLMLSVSAFSQSAPTTMNFQGRLAKTDGTPIANTATQSLTFRLYNAASGGTLLWSQTNTNVSVSNGVFSVLLNFGNGFAFGQSLSTVFSGISLYLETQIGTSAPLTPRQSFASVPYAFLANSALSVPNGSIGLNQLASGLLNFSNISGQITDSQIAPATITLDKFASGVGGFTTSQQGILGKFSFVTVPSDYALIRTTATVTRPESLTIVGKYAYVVGDGGTLQIFDVSNPISPVLTGSAGAGNTPTSVAVSGNYAYVTNYLSYTLQVYDVSNPSNPVSIANVTTSTFPSNIGIVGNYAYVSHSGTTLDVYDISTPASPKLKTTVNTGSGYHAFTVSGNYIYLPNSTSNSLQIFDITIPASPTLKGSIAISGGVERCAVSGNYAYVTNEATLQVIDVSNPASPLLKASISTTGFSVSVAGSYLYIANDTTHTLEVYDLTNPASPVLSSTAGLSGSYCSSITVSGDYIYLTDIDDNTLQIFTPMGLQIASDVVITGKVGIGTTAPAYALDVVGDINAHGSVRANGIALSSDARYKTNIATLPNALNDALNLRGMTYDFDRAKWPAKNFPAGKQVGFIAQELEKIYPELVQTDKDGYKSVNYVGVVPVLVEAIKTHQKQLDAQKQEIAELKQQLAAIIRERAKGGKQAARLAQIKP